MRRTTRTATAVLAAALAFGAASPAASAAGRPDHAKAGHVKAEKGEKGGKPEKADKADKADKELRQLLRDIARTDAKLVKVARESRTARIGDHAATVLANVAADRSALEALAAAVQASDSTADVRAVRKELKDVRPQNYNKVVNDLRDALRLAAAITEARAAVEGDAAAPASELDAAQAALDAAVAKALLVNASSDKEELRAVKTDLQAAHEALEVVRDYLDLSEEEPVEEEPVEEEPVDEPVMG